MSRWPMRDRQNAFGGFYQGTEIAVDEFVEHMMAMKWFCSS